MGALKTFFLRERALLRIHHTFSQQVNLYSKLLAIKPRCFSMRYYFESGAFLLIAEGASSYTWISLLLEAIKSEILILRDMRYWMIVARGNDGRSRCMQRADDSIKRRFDDIKMPINATPGRRKWRQQKSVRQHSHLYLHWFIVLFSHNLNSCESVGPSGNKCMAWHLHYYSAC